MDILGAPATDEAYTALYAIALVINGHVREYTKEEPAPQPPR